MNIRDATPQEVERIRRTAPKSLLWVDGATYFVAEHDSRVAGLISITIKGTHVKLRNSFVYPFYRKRGIGLALHSYCLDRAIERGCTVAEGFCTTYSLPLMLKLGATKVRS